MTTTRMTTTETPCPSPAIDRGRRALSPRAGLAASAKVDRAAERLDREAAIRRALFVASLAGFAALFGLIAAADKPAVTASAPQPTLAGQTNAPARVLAEVPVANLDGDGVPTIIRIVAPGEPATQSHVRTRATP